MNARHDSGLGIELNFGFRPALARRLRLKGIKMERLRNCSIKRLAAFLQQPNTASLQYAMIDKPLYIKHFSAGPIIGFNSENLKPLEDHHVRFINFC